MIHDEYECDETCNGRLSSVNDHTRRRGGRLLFQSMFLGALSWQSFRQISHADDGSAILSPANKGTAFLSGTVTLPPGMTAPGGEDNNNIEGADSSSKSALYITARPNRPDNVPKAILDGSRGKSPPVLTARFESPVFPLQFNLSERDLTPEGADNNNGNDQTTNTNTFWWAADDLIVSARWDSDGVAATRSPEDLVGRNLWKHNIAVNNKDDSGGFVLSLQGRGSFGKFATKK